MHSCKQCLKRFSSQSSLQFHFVIHTSLEQSMPADEKVHSGYA